MFKNVFFVVNLIVVLCVVGAKSGDLWSSLSLACRHDDSKCIKESTKSLLPYFANGIPEYGVEKVDPLSIKYIDSSTPSLSLILDDVTVTGLKGCHVRKIERNVAKSTMVVKVTCSVHVEGHYKMKGRLIVLPIEGDGKIQVDLKNIKMNVFIDMGEMTGNDGKKHWDIKSWKHTYELKEKSNLAFENLFNGNEILGRAARELIATNSNDIIVEVGPPVIKAIVKSIVDSVNIMYHAIPAEDLSID